MHHGCEELAGLLFLVALAWWLIAPESLARSGPHLEIYQFLYARPIHPPALPLLVHMHRATKIICPVSFRTTQQMGTTKSINAPQ
jgi:hypothetical protein